VQFFESQRWNDPSDRTIDPTLARLQNRPMARYSALLGKFVDVRYRVGEILLPATGMLAADSGKSIFLENHFSEHRGSKTFRWEIPYKSIVHLAESGAAQTPSAEVETAKPF
jgi:hypothetical protein